MTRTLEERLAAERRSINKVCGYGPPHVNDFSPEWAGCTIQWREPCYTYALFSEDRPDDENTVLYIGVADDWRRRLSQHKQTKPWWSEVAEVGIEKHCCRPHALECEAFGICDSEPRYNIAHPRHRFGQSQSMTLQYTLYTMPGLVVF